MKPHPEWRLADWLAWQERLHPRQIELGLERVREVARRLDLPHSGPRTLTIGGTNGKGSSATLAALIYRQAGYRVGLYTSPHLLRYNERIAVEGQAASDEDLCRAFRAIEAVRGEISLTYFEFGTLAALWLFREAGVQVQVLEVGLGGRLDAVNLVDCDCALVTNVGLDHTDWLGADRESIAREKAGILRAGRPAIYAEHEPPASLRQRARDLPTGLRVLGRDFDFDAAETHWHWRGARGGLDDLPLPGLRGVAQLRNAAGVLAAVELMQPQLPVPEAAIRGALPALRLPGRFERRGELILDVAHNVEAAQVLADNLRAELNTQAMNRSIHLVLGMLSDKPVPAFCRVLAPLVRRAYFASLPPPRGLSAAELAQRAAEGGLPGEVCGDVRQALARARAELPAGGTILVAGSFLTVAAA